MRCRRRRLKHHLLEFRWVTVLSSNSSHCSCITSCVGAVSEKIKSHLTGLWGAAGYFFLKRPYKSDVSAHKWARYTSIRARKPHTEVLTWMKTKMAHKLLAHESMCVLMWCLQMIFIVRSIGGSSSLVCECSKFCCADLFWEKSERNEIGYHFFFFLKTSQSSIKSKATFLFPALPCPHTHTRLYACRQSHMTVLLLKVVHKKRTCEFHYNVQFKSSFCSVFAAPRLVVHGVDGVISTGIWFISIK